MNINKRIERYRKLPFKHLEEDIYIGQPATFAIGTSDIPLTVIAVEGKVGKRKVTLQEHSFELSKETEMNTYPYRKYVFKSNEFGELHYFQEKNMKNKIGKGTSYKRSWLNPKTKRLNKDYGMIWLGFKKRHTETSYMI